MPPAHQSRLAGIVCVLLSKPAVNRLKELRTQYGTLHYMSTYFYIYFAPRNTLRPCKVASIPTPPSAVTYLYRAPYFGLIHSSIVYT